MIKVDGRPLVVRNPPGVRIKGNVKGFPTSPLVKHPSAHVNEVLSVLLKVVFGFLFGFLVAKLDLDDRDVVLKFVEPVSH